jgi:hypothetical protein
MALNVSQMYAIFMYSNSYLLFLAQFIPQEVIEQLSALLSHHPVVVKRSLQLQKDMKRKVQRAFTSRLASTTISPRDHDTFRNNSKATFGDDKGGGRSKSSSIQSANPTTGGTQSPSAVASPASKNPLAGRDGATPDGVKAVHVLQPHGDDDNEGSNLMDPLEVAEHLKVVGVEIASRELGEDCSFIMAAFCCMPWFQAYFFFPVPEVTVSNFIKPSADNILICLFCFALAVEHALSVSGIMAIERKGVEVTHKSVNLDFRVITETMFANAFFLMLLSAGEA